ncbi:oligosaccharide flippase family protein [Maribacter luteus]|uniref:oligosaccharide flippase family protein n=1 Tax=Maribacter luteus TaxID=2594478 RepID=UPI0024928FCB|nr:oligosaccharide flippase family protein [Maribacter luteus]
MSNLNENSKIAKNTIYLYIRMLFSMAVALYTSRVVLDVLGVEDFGVYSVVGGVVTLFSFFNSAMSSATQRFFSFELGRKNSKNLSFTFNASVNIHILIGILVFILAETIGLWFVNNKLNLPLENLSTVQWVYHLSVLTFLVGIIRVPYNAMIIAHERMITYAYFSIIEVALKLLIVYLLIVIQTNKLILYAVLVFAVTFLIGVVYIVYCIKHFKESKYQFYYEPKLYKTLLSYSGWNLFGNIASVAKGQGSNILLNIFFGPAMNTAFAITLQVQSAVSVFITNFQLAINPQIIKNYSGNDLQNMFFLILQASKISFILMYILSIPLLFDTEFIMAVWLKNVPEYSVSFVLLMIINLLIESFSGPLMTGTQATGKIKYYQIIVGLLLFLNLPISYVFLRIYEIPQIVFIISMVLSSIALIARLFILKHLTGFSITIFLEKVLLKAFLIVIFSLGIPYLIIKIMEVGVLRLIILLIASSSTVLVLSYFIGIDKRERKQINKIVSKKLNL